MGGWTSGKNLKSFIPRRFLLQFIVLSIWTAALGYAAFTATIKSPVTVVPASTFHVTSASTECDPSIQCAASDIFQPTCTITGGTSVTCGNTSIQAGEIYDINVTVAGGSPGSTHNWSASSQSSIVTPTPSSGSFTLDSSGSQSFTVKVVSALSLSGSDTVTVNVT